MIVPCFSDQLTTDFEIEEIWLLIVCVRIYNRFTRWKMVRASANKRTATFLLSEGLRSFMVMDFTGVRSRSVVERTKSGQILLRMPLIYSQKVCNPSQSGVLSVPSHGQDFYVQWKSVLYYKCLMNSFYNQRVVLGDSWKTIIFGQLSTSRC